MPAKKGEVFWKPDLLYIFQIGSKKNKVFLGEEEE